MIFCCQAHRASRFRQKKRYHRNLERAILAQKGLRVKTAGIRCKTQEAKIPYLAFSVSDNGNTR